MLWLPSGLLCLFSGLLWSPLSQGKQNWWGAILNFFIIADIQFYTPLLSTIISEANTPTMFCIILKRVRKDLPWHYPDIFCVPGNDVKYVLTAIGQHIEHKKSKGGLSISKKIWRRLDEGVFINTPIEQHVSLLTWTDETQTIIQKQGVAFLYKLHTA